MTQWIMTQNGKGTCPYCRATWEASDIDARKIDLKAAEVNEEGYINVASQLGLSGERGELQILIGLVGACWLMS